jgi:hypothetical protein
MGLCCIKCLYLIILIAQFGFAMLTFGKIFVNRVKGTHSVHVNSKLLSINDRIRDLCARGIIYPCYLWCGDRRVWILGGGNYTCDQLCTVPVAVFRLSALANDNGIKNSRTLTIIECSVFSPPLVGLQRSWEAEDCSSRLSVLFLALPSRFFVKCSHTTVRSYCKYTSVLFSEEKRHWCRTILSHSGSESSAWLRHCPFFWMHC